jgi:hypothetical protein
LYRKVVRSEQILKRPDASTADTPPRRGIQLPQELRASLEAVFGETVDHVRIVENSLFAKLHGRAVATTRRGKIYLRGSAAEFFEDPTLVLHEYFHVIRQWQPRALTTWRYVLECFRRGYWDNRFEIEAREFTSDNVFRYRALVAQHRARAGDAVDEVLVARAHRASIPPAA